MALSYLSLSIFIFQGDLYKYLRLKSQFIPFLIVNPVLTFLIFHAVYLYSRNYQIMPINYPYNSARNNIVESDKTLQFHYFATWVHFQYSSILGNKSTARSSLQIGPKSINFTICIKVMYFLIDCVNHVINFIFVNK
eukprot:NODE_685_length_4747_cov_0.548623.p5 type:complete len:137 gc:universal NODE_685_length_4747_cov_0.548623:2793-2383(-)